MRQSNIYNLNLFHPKYTTKTKMPEFFVNKAKRGRKAGKDSAKDYGKALDKPIVVASTPVVTPESSPDTAPKAKKIKKQLSSVPPKENKEMNARSFATRK